MRAGKFALNDGSALTAGTWQLVDRLASADQYTKLLIHGTENTIADSSLSNKTITNNSVTNDGSIYKFPSTSMKFVRASSQYLTLADSADWTLGTDDFTIEFWVYFNALTAATNQIFFSHSNGNSYANLFFLYYNIDNNYFTLQQCDGAGGGNATNINFSWTVTALSTSIWYHIAVVRQGVSFKLYINGVCQQGDRSTSDPVLDATSLLNIGRGDYAGGVSYLDANMQDFRWSKGIARYSENFDPYTKLLIHANSGNNTTVFSDAATGKTITTNGNAKIVTGDYYFYPSSALLDGTNSYLSLSDSDDWNFGTGDFTIDFWVKFNTASTEQIFVSQYQDGSNYWYIAKNSSGANNTLGLRFRVAGSDVGLYVMSSAWSVSTGVWYHLVFERTGTSAKIFINGVSQTLTQTTAFGTNDVGNLSGNLEVGRFGNNSDYVDGYMDEIRISKGIARWTSDFTPPNATYTGAGFNPPVKPVDGHEVLTTTVLSGRDIYTQLLIHADGANGSTNFVDAAKNKTITANGSAIIATAQKKFGTGSISLNGTTDYLSIADSPDWCLGTNNFTLDAWVRFNSLPSNGFAFPIISQSVDVNNFWSFYLLNNSGSYYYYFLTSISGDLRIIAGAYTVPAISTWYHVAVIRNNNNFLFAVNGTITNYGTNTANIPDLAAPLTIGYGVAAGAGFYYFNGNIDEVRLSKGVARWNADFTPPTASYGLNGDTDIQYRLKSLFVNGGGALNYYLRLNNDSGTNYGYQILYGTDNVAYASSGTGTGIWLQANNSSGDICQSNMLMLAKTTGYARPFLQSNIKRISSTTVYTTLWDSQTWNNTVDPLASMTIFSDAASGLGNGTQIELYARRGTL